MVIELKADSSIALVETKGAELISFKDVFGYEYMWQKDSQFWNRCSPILFPIVGNLRDNKIDINNKSYQMDKHGFCRDREFKISYQSETKLILTTSYDEETLKHFPFKFSLTLTYSLTGGELSIGYTVLNLGTDDMYYCIGAHPAFNMPIGEGKFEDFSISFNKSEPEGCPIYDLEKLEVSVDNRIDLLKGENKFMLTYNLFDEDAVVFDHLHSDEIKLSSIKTGRGVMLSLKNFDSIGFWTPTKKNAPFICLEPWNGMAVRSDEIGDNADFEHKYSARKLKENEQHTMSMTIIPL